MPKRIQDIATRHQVLLERLKAGGARDLAASFNSVERATLDILSALSVPGVGDITKRELETMLAELRAVNSELLFNAMNAMMTNLEHLAGDSAQFEASALGSLSSKIKMSVPTQAAAYRYALNQPLSATGQLLETFVNDWSTGEVDRINNVVRRAWGEGWSIGRLTSSISGTKALDYQDGIVAISRRNAASVARTAIQHIASASRMKTWEDNKDIVESYKYVATLDSKTTQLCRSLDGQVFPVGAGPVPPLHINCRSTTVAILNPALGLDFLDEGATRSAEDGPAPANETYYDWLGGQSADFQKVALGATRAKLFRDGGLTAEKFAALNLGRNFQPLTLAEMRKLAPSAFAKAGIPPNN